MLDSIEKHTKQKKLRSRREGAAAEVLKNVGGVSMTNGLGSTDPLVIIQQYTLFV